MKHIYFAFQLCYAFLWILIIIAGHFLMLALLDLYVFETNYWCYEFYDVSKKEDFLQCYGWVELLGTSVFISIMNSLFIGYNMLKTNTSSSK